MEDPAELDELERILDSLEGQDAPEVVELARERAIAIARHLIARMRENSHGVVVHLDPEEAWAERPGPLVRARARQR